MDQTQVQAKKRLPTWKKILLVTLAVVILFMAIVVFAYFRYLHPTGRIMPGIYAIRNDNNGIPFVNFFLFQIGEQYIAFDAGSDHVQTERTLQRLDIAASDISAVFLTHGDRDHMGSLHLFDNATIYTGPIELYAFDHHIMPDGNIIEIGGVSIQVIYTPGHTSGCVIYLVDSRYLFVGDLLVSPNHARYDMALQIENQEKALGIEGVAYVFTGHFGLFRSIGLFRWWFG